MAGEKQFEISPKIESTPKKEGGAEHNKESQKELEQKFEVPKSFIEKKSKKITAQLSDKTQSKNTIKKVVTKSKQLLKVEKILEEGLVDYYKEMDDKQRKKFKDEGEEIAIKIEKLLAKTRINLYKIIRLIYKWLKLIPGVNKFFLQQQAKIKAEQFLKIHKKENPGK